MLGLGVMILALFFSAGLMARTKPGGGERQVGMVSFVCLTPGMITGRLPFLILPILLLLLAGYLYRAR